MKRNLIIVVILVVILAVIWIIYGGGSAPVHNVVLEAAASQESYDRDEEVNISIKLKNEGETAVCLSDGALGNIQVVSHSKDGAALETRSAPSRFITSFSEILKSYLTPVAPGESLEFVLKSEEDPGLGKVTLSTTKPEGTWGTATFYDVEEPGNYELGLVYEYVSGASADCSEVFEGRTNIATVTFSVK